MADSRSWLPEVREIEPAMCLPSAALKTEILGLVVVKCEWRAWSFCSVATLNSESWIVRLLSIGVSKAKPDRQRPRVDYG